MIEEVSEASHAFQCQAARNWQDEAYQGNAMRFLGENTTNHTWRENSRACVCPCVSVNMGLPNILSSGVIDTTCTREL